MPRAFLYRVASELLQCVRLCIHFILGYYGCAYVRTVHRGLKHAAYRHDVLTVMLEARCGKLTLSYLGMYVGVKHSFSFGSPDVV